MSTIGERLKSVRLSLGLTQQQVADAIGKSKGNVSGYENGNFEPSASTIVKLAECFNISTDVILIGENGKSPQSDLTESEREILKLVQPLSDVDKIKVLGVIENYLGSRASAFPNVQPIYITEEQASKLFKETAKKTL